jgi:hypothetical protein
MSVWFVEVPRMGGGWSPQLIHGDRPSHKTSEGVVKGFRAEPKELHPDEAAHLTLTELQEMYGEPDISPRYIEPELTTEEKLVRALEPVLYWYQSDEEPDSDPVEIVTEIVKDLQSDRAENLRTRTLLREFANLTLGAEVEYPMDIDWRYRCEKIIKKVRDHLHALTGEGG